MAEDQGSIGGGLQQLPNSHSLATWIISDLDMTVLEQHAGPLLRGLGASVEVLNLFELFRVESLKENPALIVLACAWPPLSCRSYLDHLIARYTKNKPSDGDRARFYETMCLEAITGQVPVATTVVICRGIDGLKPGPTPVLTAPLAHVPGYVPKQQYLTDEGELQPLAGGQDLYARVQVGGPLVPDDFITDSGKINLVEMCAVATYLNIRVLFLGEHDGSLSLGCGMGVMYHQQQKVVRPLSVSHPTDMPMKVLGGYTGAYTDFYDHAKEVRIRQLLEEHLRGQQANLSWSQPTIQMLQPHLNMNTAVMWLSAKQVEVQGDAIQAMAAQLSPSS